MDVTLLHSPHMRRVIEAINQDQINDFMPLFTQDAIVMDGPTYSGYDAIRTWAQRETFGVQMHIDVLQEINPAGTLVALQIKSTGGYTGPATFSLTLRGELIERLEIH
ncbi:hypothetical protein KDA_73440 [Dictyobacter alpinus]|uniref:SnoaL-like domain-containing protein n=1 Tax=Dictyobacter alpinus TaxID=2014873 RepID=A0A402BKL5_9CHLR|nr:nuclear transport factor 2 family protein [Dictyobacter alpinus]GCE31860.1 hypothetical protein KDA_73440 [Dictyobacter alpinus]